MDAPLCLGAEIEAYIFKSDPPRLPDEIIYLNRDKKQSAVSTLFHNAIKFTPFPAKKVWQT